MKRVRKLESFYHYSLSLSLSLPLSLSLSLCLSLCASLSLALSLSLSFSLSLSLSLLADSRCLSKEVFLKISQYSQKTKYLRTVFFYRTPLLAAFDSRQSFPYVAKLIVLTNSPQDFSKL